MQRLHLAILIALILLAGAARAAFVPSDLPNQNLQKQDATVTQPQHKSGESADDPKVPPRRPPRLAKPRIAPIARESWTDAEKTLLGPLERQGQVYNVFTTIANHPDLARDWLTFATQVLRKSTLPPREREILILRIGWLCGSEYEWAQHVRIGKREGLTEDDLRHIRQGPSSAGASVHDRLLLKAVDELHTDAFISDDTWNKLAETYNTRQMMDSVFAVGQYNLVSMALNSFGVQLDPGLEGFPN